VPGRDLWNAIDANVIVDESGTPWMSFGSFWTGIKLVKLEGQLEGAGGAAGMVFPGPAGAPAVCR